jgi:hypothetical protein
MAIRSTRLKCSKHGVWLVLNEHIVHKASGPVRIEFWSCPLLCGHVRARKDQVKPVKRRVARKSLAITKVRASHKSDTDQRPVKRRVARKSLAITKVRASHKSDTDQRQASFGF